MNEVWKDIKDYEGIYKVSNYARVKRVIFTNGTCNIPKERLLTATDNGHGYLIIGLSKNNKRKNYYLHRLVAEAFIDNPLNKPEVNHKDGNKSNNCVDNLEWVTSKENHIHSSKILNTKYNLTGLNITREKQKKKVSCIDKNGKIIKIFDSISEASREMKVNPSSICGCCRGNYKTGGGYKWQYKDGV